MNPDPHTSPPEPAESAPSTPEPAVPQVGVPQPVAPAAEANGTVRIPAQASPPVFEADATVKMVPGAASQPAAPAPPPAVEAVQAPPPAVAAAPASQPETKNDDFLTEAQAPAVAPHAAYPAAYPAPAPAPPAPASAMPQATLPSPVAPPAQGYAMTPPPMGPPTSPVGPPPVMATGPIPLPMAPRKPRNTAAITFAVIALVLLALAATFGILYSEKTNDFDDQAEQLAAVEAERDELEDEIVALQLERDALQEDSDARQACSDALQALIDDEYRGTIDDLEDFASPEYLEWAQDHEDLYQEAESQCLA